MSETEVFLINAFICVGFGIGGFLVRMALEAWRDYHIAKALHEANPQNARVRRYRAAQHRKPMIPKDVLEKFASGLKRKKRAIMAYDHGRWTNAA